MVVDVVPARGRRARRLPAAVRREQILEAAITVFASAGFREASTAAIAAGLGVSEPTLFRHFPTKRALYLAALDRTAEVVMERWRAIATAAPSPLVALFEVGRWYYGALQEDSRYLRLRFRSLAESGDPDVRSRVQAHFRAGFDFVHDLYASARAAGEVAAETDARAHAWMFMAVGALLDTTQVIGLRDDLALDVLSSVFRLATPPPADHHTRKES